MGREISMDRLPRQNEAVWYILLAFNPAISSVTLPNPSDGAPNRLRQFLATRNPVVLSVAVLGGFILFAIVLVLTAPQPQAVLADLPSLTVQAHTVARRDITPHATFTGRLQPRRSTALRFEVTGQLRKREVEPGMVVAEGDTLLALDDRDFRDRERTAAAELRLEEGRIKRDQIQLEQATRRRDLQRKEVARHKRLGERLLLSQSSLNAAEQTLLDLESRVAELTHSVDTGAQRLALKQSQFDQAQRDLERAHLDAPFSGTVNAVMAEVGDRITGEQTVATLVDVAELDFYAEVDGATARAQTLNQTITVSAGHRKHPGVLVALQTDPDPLTFTHALRIRIPGADVAPGQLAEIRLPLPTLNDALVVPVEAIRVDAAGQSVFRIQGETLERVRVTPGPRVGEWQVVEAALEEGDRIVARDVAAMDVQRTVRVHDPDA